jgi:hypothetical protein
VYKTGAESQIQADRNSLPQASIVDFAECVAASALVHCGDGWGYLGRAADAILKGDLHASVHLIYYSELRASMALLATQGIYIGSGRHFALDGAGGAALLSAEGTHAAAWKIFDVWRQSSGAATLRHSGSSRSRTPKIGN